ncbi:hypothetical protein Tco_1232669 [Tanacetum coccineum]
MKDGIFFNQSKYIKEMLKKFGLEDSKPTKTPLLTEIKLTKDDEADSVDSTKYRGMIGSLLYLTASRFVTEFYHSLEVKKTHDDYPYIEFKLGSFTFELSLSKLTRIFKTPHKGIVFYTNDLSLNSLDGHVNNRFFSPDPKSVKQIITIIRTTKRQLQRDPNKLFQDDLRPKVKGWELFLKENVFNILGNRDHVNVCTAYMLYYLKIKKTFDLTTMIVLRMDDVKKNNDAPMPYAMLLTRLYKYILQTNPQSIVPLNRFTYHQCVMNPLDFKKKSIKDKGKRAVVSLKIDVDVDKFKRCCTSYTFDGGYKVLSGLLLYRLLHQVVTALADRIRDNGTSQSKQNFQSSSMTFITFQDLCFRQELLEYMVIHNNDASESSKPSWGKMCTLLLSGQPPGGSNVYYFT